MRTQSLKKKKKKNEQTSWGAEKRDWPGHDWVNNDNDDDNYNNNHNCNDNDTT